MKKINSIHGNKGCLNCSRRDARITEGEPNEAGEVEDKDILIFCSDKELSTSVTEYHRCCLVHQQCYH